MYDELPNLMDEISNDISTNVNSVAVSSEAISAPDAVVPIMANEVIVGDGINDVNVDNSNSLNHIADFSNVMNASDTLNEAVVGY